MTRESIKKPPEQEEAASVEINEERDKAGSSCG